MDDDCFPALSPAHRTTVLDALRSAFGTDRADAVVPVAGGASGASPYRVDIGARRFLVRVEGAASPLRNPHQYESMRIAAAAGIAPPVHWIDETARVAVIEFVEPKPLAGFPGGPQALLRALGELVRRLQSTPAFPHFVDYPDIVARLFAHVRRTGLFAPDVLAPHAERLEHLGAAYRSDAVRLGSSHNDLIPGNILFDGKRLWLIDWESAYRNDPLVDVATVLDTLAPSPELEEVFLQAWLGHRAGAALRNRLELVRALTRLYYAGVFLSASAAASWTTAETDLSAPTPLQFRQAVADGRLKPGATESKHVLGKMFLASFLTGGAAPGFDAAV